MDMRNSKSIATVCIYDSGLFFLSSESLVSLINFAFWTEATGLGTILSDRVITATSTALRQMGHPVAAGSSYLDRAFPWPQSLGLNTFCDDFCFTEK